MRCRTRRTSDGSLNQRDRGAVMVELAFILPILVMLLVGIIEFGRAYSAQVSIQGAAREGARSLALKESSGSVDAAVQGAAGSAQVTSVTKVACPAVVSGTTTSYASVTVNATFTFSIPFVSLGTTNMSATARMRCGL